MLTGRLNQIRMILANTPQADLTLEQRELLAELNSLNAMLQPAALSQWPGEYETIPTPPFKLVGGYMLLGDQVPVKTGPPPTRCPTCGQLLLPNESDPAKSYG